MNRTVWVENHLEMKTAHFLLLHFREAYCIIHNNLTPLEVKKIDYFFFEVLTSELTGLPD